MSRRSAKVTKAQYERMADVAKAKGVVTHTEFYALDGTRTVVDVGGPELMSGKTFGTNGNGATAIETPEDLQRLL